MKKNITKYLLIAVCTVMLFSCAGKDEKVGHSDLYFPVEKLVEAQVDSLKKSSDIWKKTVVENGNTETKNITAKDLDWKTELTLFYDLTPNKNAYIGKFKIDTVTKADENIITYTSNNLKLSSLVIRQASDGTVKAIYGDIKNSNIFYTSYYKLDIVPYQAFMITGEQSLRYINSTEQFSISWIKEQSDSVTVQATNP